MAWCERSLVPKPKLGDDWRVDSDWRPTPVLYPYWPGPGLFAARLTWSYWKRFVLPKTHEGCVSPVPRREVSCLPSEPLMPYEAGPGDCVHDRVRESISLGGGREWRRVRSGEKAQPWCEPEHIFEE